MKQTYYQHLNVRVQGTFNFKVRVTRMLGRRYAVDVMPLITEFLSSHAYIKKSPY